MSMHNRGPSKAKIWAVTVGIGLAVIAIGLAVFVNIHTVEGNEMAVLETWGGGVQDEPLHPKTYIKTPGFLYEFYDYDMSAQVYVMNNKSSNVEFAEGREEDAYEIQSKEGQDLTFSTSTMWRLDPERLVHLHKTIRTDFEEKILRPELLREIKDAATVIEAIVAYSGDGLVRLQATIESALKDPEGDIRRRGIIVENFVIEKIELDPEYRDQIKRRQVAVQSELRAEQETQAAFAEAKKVEAEAQADLNRQVVAAERDKQIGVLGAQKSAEMEVLAAQASKQKQVLAAEGEKESGVLRAEAILAIGNAEAAAQKVKLQAYAVEGADNFVRIEIARSMAEAFQNIDGYLPGDMNITLLSSSFMQSLQTVMGGNQGLDPSLAKR